ncbi:MAG: DinB family protein [Acidimicrobiales bacterium]|jgi:hypothetical protein
MADRKPPRLSTDEPGTSTALLGYQRASLVRKVDGLSTEQASWSPVPSGTSVLWLVGHMAEAEQSWVVRRFAGREAVPGDVNDEVPAGIEEAVAAYRATWPVVDEIVAGAPGLEAPCRGEVGDPPVNLRWILAHPVEETARHAGHADIIRELIDGSTGR